jgi:hypothetical protein
MNEMKIENKEWKMRPQNQKKDLEYYKQRFLNLLIEKEECLLFTGSLGKKGYGHFHNHNEIIAHRFSWFINNGPIPDGLHVLHHCDVRNCVKIQHLWLGTDQDNSDDKMKKNRDRKLSGENNPRSKISDAQAIEIAKMFTSGKTPTEIAKELNVSRYIIYHMMNKHVRKNIEFYIPKKEIKLKTCLECKKEYRTKPYRHENSKYCSPSCRHRYMTGRTKEQIKSKR